MRGLSYYRAEASHARRLADMTIQPNVEEVLRRVAEEFDRLADDFTNSKADFHHPEIPETFVKRPAIILAASSPRKLAIGQEMGTKTKLC
jgi:hypothetical protein